MAKFQQGHKFGKGGKRPGAGRPSKTRQKIKAEAARIAKEFIEQHTAEVLQTYLTNAKGHYEKRFTEDGKEYEVWIVDPATTRHWIDKFVPPAKQEIKIGGNIGIILKTNVPSRKAIDSGD